MQNEKLSVTLDNPNLPKKNPGCVELPIEFYKAWHSFDFVSSYANLRPKAEQIVQISALLGRSNRFTTEPWRPVRNPNLFGFRTFTV